MIAVAGVISTLWGNTQIIGKQDGSNPEYIDKNYGLTFIWDRLFGTFQPEESPVNYGLVNNVNTFNPIKITFMGWNYFLI